jgi:hypothetical protein
MNDFLSHLKKEVDKISIPEKELNDAIQSAIRKGKKKKWSLRKKIIYWFSVYFTDNGGGCFKNPLFEPIIRI